MAEQIARSKRLEDAEQLKRLQRLDELERLKQQAIEAQQRSKVKSYASQKYIEKKHWESPTKSEFPRVNFLF